MRASLRTHKDPLQQIKVRSLNWRKESSKSSQKSIIVRRRTKRKSQKRLQLSKTTKQVTDQAQLDKMTWRLVRKRVLESWNHMRNTNRIIFVLAISETHSSNIQLIILEVLCNHLSLLVIELLQSVAAVWLQTALDHKLAGFHLKLKTTSKIICFKTTFLLRATLNMIWRGVKMTDIQHIRTTLWLLQSL